MEIGVDIVEIDRFEVNQFGIRRILSPQEIEEFITKNTLGKGERKREFLAGRGACKEAIIKAMGENIPFNLLTIVINNNRLNCSYKNWSFKISLSHNKSCCVAFVIGYQLKKT